VAGSTQCLSRARRFGWTALVAVLPPVLHNLGLGALAASGVQVLRWVLLVALVMGRWQSSTGWRRTGTRRR